MSEITGYCVEDRVVADHVTSQGGIEYHKCPVCGETGAAKNTEAVGLRAVFPSPDLDPNPLAFTLGESGLPSDVEQYEEEEEAEGEDENDEEDNGS